MNQTFDLAAFTELQLIGSSWIPEALTVHGGKPMPIVFALIFHDQLCRHSKQSAKGIYLVRVTQCLWTHLSPAHPSSLPNRLQR